MRGGRLSLPFWSIAFLVTWMSLMLGSLEYWAARRQPVFRDPAWWSTTGPMAGAILSLASMLISFRAAAYARERRTLSQLRKPPENVLRPGVFTEYKTPNLCAGCGVGHPAESFNATAATQTERLTLTVPLCSSCLQLQQLTKIFAFAIIDFVGFALSIIVVAWQHGVAGIGWLAALVLTGAFVALYRFSFRDRHFAAVEQSGRGWAFNSRDFTAELVRLNQWPASWIQLEVLPRSPHSSASYEDLLSAIRAVRDKLDAWAYSDGEAALAAFRKEANEIGRELNERGGKRYMLRAYDEAKATRSIEIAWDGIGEWRG